MWQHQPGRPLVFNHLPKTAGTALSEAIVAATSPARVVHGLDGVVFGDFDQVDTIHRRVRDAVIIAPEDIAPDAEYVTGHVAPSTTRARFPDGWHMTVLREPRTRLLSLWLFARTRPGRWSRSWGAYSDLVLAAGKPLQDYLTDPHALLATDNMLTRMMLWPHPLIEKDRFIDEAHDDQLLDEARSRLATFDFVGVVEDPAMTSKLGAALGVALDVHRRQENAPLPTDRRPDLRAEVARAANDIARCTRLDEVLWREAYAANVSGTDPVAAADAAYEKALERYVALTHGPPPPGTLSILMGRAGRVIMGAARSRRDR